MGALTSSTPKPLLPVGDRPIIGHILAGLSAAGIGSAIVVVGYLGEQIERHVGGGSAYGLLVEYRRQPRPEGTARALLSARRVLAEAPFLLSWGDILVGPRTYLEMLESFRRHPCAALLAVNEVDDPWRGAAVYVDGNGRVTRVVEKPAPGSSSTRWNNSGIFIFDPAILDYAARLEPSSRGEYELPAAIASMLDDGREIRAQPVYGFWSDVGTPEDLRDAEAALGRGAPR